MREKSLYPLTPLFEIFSRTSLKNIILPKNKKPPPIQHYDQPLTPLTTIQLLHSHPFSSVPLWLLILFLNFIILLLFLLFNEFVINFVGFSHPLYISKDIYLWSRHNCRHFWRRGSGHIYYVFLIYYKVLYNLTKLLADNSI
jgi:hypothetical protein